MNRSASRGRRWASAAVLGMALPLVAACWTASAGSVLPTASASSSSTSSSSPTPCPIIVLGTPDPSCNSIGGGTPAPTSTPSGSGATPTPTPTPAGSGSGGSGGGGGGGGPTAPGAAPASSAAASAAAAGVSINPPALLGLLNVLNAPANVGVERPILRHFDVIDGAGGTTRPAVTPAVSTTAARQGGGPGAGAGPVLALLAALVAGGAAVAASRRFPVVAMRRRVLASIPLGGVAAVGFVLLGAHAAPAPAIASTAATASPEVVRVAVHHAAAVDTPVFEQLTAIESDITSVASRLVLAATPPADSDNQTTNGVVRGYQRGQLISELTTQYNNDLQSEYAFFTAVVPDDTKRTQLLAAAAAAPQPVADAVSYNVDAVQAMLQQENAINAAQAAAQTVLGPAPTALLAPEQGVVTQPFGPSQFTIEPPLTFNGVTYPHFHTGVDICNALDNPIHAAADGVVVIAGSSLDSHGNLIGYGNYIVLQHAGKMITLYAHLDKLLVKPGQVVKRGDVIGLEGSTGYSTGPHLHFEVRIAGLLADPLKYLGTQLKGPAS